MTPFGLGGIPRTKKKIDYHADSYGSAVPTPASYSTPVPIIYMQNQQPCCGADMVTQYLNVLFSCVGSPEYTWKNVRYIDGLPADSGSDAPTLAHEAQQDGTCDLSLMNDDSLDSEAQYASYTGITPQMIQQAQSRKIANYAFIDNPTFQQIKDNIFQHKAVGLLVDCGDGFWTNKVGASSWAATDVLPLRVGNFVDHHFLLATGFDETTIKGPNSWSTAWGDTGMYNFDKFFISHVKELIIFIPPITPLTPTPAKYQFTQDFGFGTTSADVHRLQTLIGMPSALCTGYFGLLTSMYVWAFKYRNSIKPYNGQCDSALRQYLNS